MTDPAAGERLKRAWQALADDELRASRPADAAVVDSEAVWRVAAGQGSAEERRRVLDALGTDPAIAESWRLASELQRELEARQDEERRVVPFKRPLVRRSLPWAAAAMLLLAVGLGLWPSLGPEDPTAYRDPTSQDLGSGVIVNLVSESEPMPRHDAVLRWSFSPAGETSGQGVSYTVRVLTSELEPFVVLSELTIPEARLPEERLADLDDPAILLWQVEAHTADGRRVTSPTFLLELVPKSEIQGDRQIPGPSTAPEKPSDAESSSAEP